MLPISHKMGRGTGAEGLVRLVTTRFLVLLVHFVATCTLFYRKFPLIQIELDPNKSKEKRVEQYEYIDTWLISLLALATICMLIELLGLVSGYTLHQKSANALSALAHFVGFVSTISMVLNGWSVNVYPSIFSFCSVLPAGLDALWWGLQAYTRKFIRRK